MLSLVSHLPILGITLNTTTILWPKDDLINGVYWISFIEEALIILAINLKTKEVTYGIFRWTVNKVND